MIHRLRHMVLMLALTGLFSSCSQVEDARHVVAEADSLRTAGIAYDDSLSIAEAAATLSHVRIFYPTDYARANYYYGRLLRTRGDHPAAMLAFLNVAHSRSKDFAVKARSYSNIGTMCNYAGEFAMAYDMYGQSAECFGKANETRLYYYAQNAKALQLAELSLHDETLLLLDSITSTCDDSGVLVKTWETKAFLYVNTQQYDSALHAIHMLHAAGYHDPCGYVKQAQAFWYLEQYDSALYYAQYVMSMPQAAPRDKYNMLYIITFNDSDATDPQFRERYEERADIDKEILDPQNIQYSQAMDLLRQDLNRKPDYTWFWAILVTLLVIGVPSSTYISRKRRKHQLVSQQVNDLLQKHDELSERNYLLEQKLSQRQKKMLFEIESFCTTIQNDSDLKKKLSWNDFDKMCAVVDERMYGLATKLKERYNMDLNNLRLCILITIGNFTNSEMADLLSYDEHTFRTIKNRVARNLNISGKNMRDFFLNLMIGS